jgi:hypothetical protein
MKRRQVFALSGIEDRFTRIYELNYWDNAESRSGSGSTLDYTRNLRRHLPIIFDQFSIHSVIDAPCGDFNWMRHVVQDDRVDYTGIDIVQPLIGANTRQFGSDRVRFLHRDLTRESLPAADLMICRDCLFHLSFDDTKLVLQNFLNAEIPYLLTTTHVNTDGRIRNRDIRTGDYRLMDLFSAPYNFPAAVLYELDDWQPPEPPRKMCMWHRDQIAAIAQDFDLSG